MNEKVEKTVEQEFVTIKTKEHTYSAPIMNTIDGIGFAVRFPEMFTGKLSRDELEAMVIEKITKPDTMFSLTLNLMSGMKIDEDTCDDTGICKLFRRNPVEIYRAVVVALCANFGDCFPFLEDMSGTEESPSQE